MTLTIPPSRPTLPLKAKAGGGFESAVGAGLSGGSAALSYSIAELSRDAEVTIATDGTHDFGSVGPDLTIILDASLNGSGNVIKRFGGAVTEDSGSQNLQVESNAKLPGGFGIVIGSEGSGTTAQGQGRIEAYHPESSRIFESRICHYPRSRCLSAVQALLAPENTEGDWQIKPIWNTSKSDGVDGFGGSETNFFLADFTKVDGFAATWQRTHKISSNSVATINAGTGLMDSTPESIRIPYDEPYCMESLWDQGSSFDGSADGESWHQCYSNVQGIHYTESLSGLTLYETSPSSGLANQKIKRFHYPGFVRGYTVSEGWALNEADIYRATGPGAACRVAICESANYFSSLNRTILEPVSWSNNAVKVKLRGGWWTLDSLSGKYICIIGANNQQIGSGVQI